MCQMEMTVRSDSIQLDFDGNVILTTPKCDIISDKTTLFQQ